MVAFWPDVPFRRMTMFQAADALLPENLTEALIEVSILAVQACLCWLLFQLMVGLSGIVLWRFRVLPADCRSSVLKTSCSLPQSLPEQLPVFPLLCFFLCLYRLYPEPVHNLISHREALSLHYRQKSKV